LFPPTLLFALSEEELLDLIEKTSVRFFIDEMEPSSGLIRDRVNNFTKDKNNTASIASSGFGLTSLCIAAERGWISKHRSKKLILKSLNFFLKRVEHANGFFYHFVDIKTGKRLDNCEASSIDTALFLAGAIVAKNYFKDKRISNLVDAIYDRVNWQWMLNSKDTISMGYIPESGFLKAHWNHYSEHMLLYILAIGSRTYPISTDCWHTWERPVYSYGEFEYINCSPLFTHQYSHAWVDFRDKHDDYADYFENSIQATMSNRQFCMDIQDRFKTFRRGLWGLTACDGPYGYKAYGGPPVGFSDIDGTVAPSAVCGSIVFAPRECIETLRLMYEDYKDKLWGRYGFSDSLNLDNDWYASDVIGIDQGISVLMIENYRSDFVWKYFMREKNIIDTLIKVGFRYHPKEAHIVDLKGKWNFKRGNKANLSGDISLSDWAKVEVPSTWEKEGFKGYDGYAWYRVEFEPSPQLRFAWQRSKIALLIGGIDDFDSTYINGKLVGNFYSRINRWFSYWDKRRFYIIPNSLINFNGKNVIAIRVFDKGGNGGIWKGPVKIGPVEELNFRPLYVKPNGYMLYSLEAKWLCNLGDDIMWKDIDFNDRNWKKIFVPGEIEKGFSKDYDGFFWYRFHIRIPGDLKDKKKFLYIGAIDDADEVYLNGELLGKTGLFPPDFKTAYNKERKYLLKEDKIQYNNDNVIAIRGFDIIKEGGITKGPISIIEEVE